MYSDNIHLTNWCEKKAFRKESLGLKTRFPGSLQKRDKKLS